MYRLFYYTDQFINKISKELKCMFTDQNVCMWEKA